jgi:hypothetical protein
MCLDSGSSAPAPAPRPAGAGYTVADVDTGSDKYTKVYDENQADITTQVTKNPAGKYTKKTSTSSPDLQVGGY